MKKIEDKAKESKFTKRQLYNSEMFLEEKDLINALLEEDKRYSKKEVRNILDRYLKKEVK